MRATIRIVDTVMYRIGSTSPKNLVVISEQDEEDLKRRLFSILTQIVQLCSFKLSELNPSYYKRFDASVISLRLDDSDLTIWMKDDEEDYDDYVVLAENIYDVNLSQLHETSDIVIEINATTRMIQCFNNKTNIDLNVDYNKLAGFIQISEPWKFVK